MFSKDSAFNTRSVVRQFRTYGRLGWVVTWCNSIKFTFEQELRDHVSFRFAEQSEAFAHAPLSLVAKQSGCRPTSVAARRCG